MRLEALVLAPGARAWLRRVGTARVLHLFDQACNLVAEDGSVLALVRPDVGLGPFSVVVGEGPRAGTVWGLGPFSVAATRVPGAEHSPTRCGLWLGSLLLRADEGRARTPWLGAWSFRDLVDPGAPVSAGPGWLRIGELEIDWTGAACRAPRPPWRALRRRCGALARGLRRLRAVCWEGEGSTGDARWAPGRQFPRGNCLDGERVLPGLGGRRGRFGYLTEAWGGDPGGTVQTGGGREGFGGLPKVRGRTQRARRGLPGLERQVARRRGAPVVVWEFEVPRWLLASSPARRLYRGLAGADISEVCKAARALAGLGPGLTPAGDDLLLGALYALWATRPPRYAAAVGAAVADATAPRTTRLSAAWLRAAARGEAERAWVELVRALAREDRGAVIAAARAVLGLGHSSGSCALHGFVAAARALLPAPCARGRLGVANTGGAPDGRAGHRC